MKWPEIPGAEKTQGGVADGGGRGEERGRTLDASSQLLFVFRQTGKKNRPISESVMQPKFDPNGGGGLIFPLG